MQYSLPAGRASQGKSNGRCFQCHLPHSVLTVCSAAKRSQHVSIVRDKVRPATIAFASTGMAEARRKRRARMELALSHSRLLPPPHPPSWPLHPVAIQRQEPKSRSLPCMPRTTLRICRLCRIMLHCKRLRFPPSPTSLAPYLKPQNSIQAFFQHHLFSGHHHGTNPAELMAPFLLP